MNNEAENTENQELEPFAKRRIDICNQCPEYKLYICGKCGCFMPAKTRFKGTSCPLNKWGPEV
jgi:hypothetical protein